MIERLRPECISCLVKQNLEAYPEDAPIDKKLEYMQRMLKLIGEAPRHYSAPMLVRSMNAISEELFGESKDFTEIKRYFNQLMLEKEEVLWQNILHAQDPMKLALQYAMTGNYIDFGTLNRVDEEQLEKFLKDAQGNPVNPDEYLSLKKDLQTARSLVYLTDNCGEIVLDKLLMQEMQREFPQIEITVLVRGGAVLNDATMEDALQVGLPELVHRVMGNGNNIAGTCLEELSEEALQAMEEADVILAKGQANFETLRKCGKNIYYIFMCKCDMFAREFQVPRFTGMLINDRQCI